MSEDVKVQVHTLGEIILKLEMPKTFIDEINNVFDKNVRKYKNFSPFSHYMQIPYYLWV